MIAAIAVAALGRRLQLCRSTRWACPLPDRIPTHGTEAFRRSHLPARRRSIHDELPFRGFILARAGVVSIIPDATARGDGKNSELNTMKLEAARDHIAEVVITQRRVLDLLLQQPGVDPKRIAYIGHSLRRYRRRCTCRHRVAHSNLHPDWRSTLARTSHRGKRQWLLAADAEEHVSPRNGTNSRPHSRHRSRALSAGSTRSRATATSSAIHPGSLCLSGTPPASRS